MIGFGGFQSIFTFFREKVGLNLIKEKGFFFFFFFLFLIFGLLYGCRPYISVSHDIYTGLDPHISKKLSQN